MSSTQVQLLVPSNGSAGAAVDVTGISAVRSFVYSGGDSLTQIVIEGSPDATSANFVRRFVLSQDQPTVILEDVSAFYRARLVAGAAPGTLYLGGEDGTVDVDGIEVPAVGAVAGAITDLGAGAGPVRTLIASRQDSNSVILVEGSNDGVNFALLRSIIGQTIVYNLESVRYYRTTRTAGSDLDFLWICSSSLAGGGGGGAPSGPAGGVLGFTGSTYPNPNGLAPIAGDIPILGATILRGTDGDPSAPGSNLGINAGNGGASDATNPAGSGGNAEVRAGAGGAANPVLDGGDGGGLSLFSGAGGAGGAGAQAGNGGNVDLFAGQGGPDAGGNGGDGGDINIVAGTGASANGGFAGVAGDIQIDAGQGGAADASAIGRDGGNATMTAGRGGAGSAGFLPGQGGIATVHGGDAGSDGGAGGNSAGGVVLEPGQPTGAGLEATVEVRGRFSRSTDGTQVIAANTDQILSTGRSVIRLSSVAPRDLTTAPCIFAGVIDGEMLVIINVGAQPIILESSFLVAGSRFALGGGNGQRSLVEAGSVTVMWSTAFNQWVELSYATPS